MLVNENQRKQSDIPLPAAVMLLAVVIAGLALGGNVARWEQLGNEIDAFVGQYPWVIGFSVGGIFLNAFATHIFAQRWISYRRQGRRLRELTGEDRRDHRRLWIATLFVSGATVSYGLFLNTLRTRYGMEFSNTPETLLYLVTLNMALAAAIMSHWCWRVWLRLRAHRRATAPLAEPVRISSGLALGTTYREVTHGEGA
jgi:hypothetical protein